MRVTTRILGLAGVALVGLACGALRQNLRSQFVSYRGAWSCEEPGCAESSTVQSKKGSNRGELRINQVRLQPHAGLVFYPGTPVSGMTASVRDCKGKSKEVPGDHVKAPGKNGIGSEKDSWVVWIDEGLVSDLQVGSGDCSVLVVTTHASWSDGSTYDCEGAIDLGG